MEYFVNISQENHVHISPNDSKTYRQFTLANALRVLIIHDEKVPRSAAALSVNVGHFHDPENREGMAHFLEHMLFLGTEKYPREGQFQSFISQNGGSNNAWTGTEHTTYFFDVRPAYFEEGLDRFAQFFIAPLLDADSADRERKAVDSEYKLKLQDDIRRIYQVQKETVNPAHPFSKFSVGSAETLEDRDGPITSELVTFYRDNYSANLMTLVLLGPQSLDELEAWAKTYFDSIENKSLEPRVPDAPLVTPAQQGKLIIIEPRKEVRKLTLNFSLPSMKAYYKTKPLSYIAHLLGYEGPGSLMSLLKNKGFINTLSAGGGISGSNFREFTVSLNLTPAGLDHIDDIVSYVFQTIRLIREKGLDEWRYKEKQAVQEMAFHHQEASRPIDLVSHLVMNLHHYQPDDVMYGDYMMDTYIEQDIRHMLALLTPENLRLTLIAQGYQYHEQAKWYFTPYTVREISDHQRAAWHEPHISPALTLPEPNPFISYQPVPLTLERNTQANPECIQELPGFSLWFGQETEFRVPKGSIYVAIDSPYSVASVENIVKTRVAIEMLLEAINESAYPAEVAGLNYNLYGHQGGATLHLSGFNEKMPLLLGILLDRFSNRSFKPERFNIIKAQLLRYWKNAAQDKPISRLFNALSGLLQPNNPPYPEMVEALENLEVSDLPDFVDNMLEILHVDMFVYGNWHKEQAFELAELVKNTLRVENQRYQESVRPLVRINNAGTLAYQMDCDHADSAVLVYYQAEERGPEQIALYTFANQLMSSTFFDQLRTKQQLGYMVGSANLPMNRVPGLIFYVQSPHGDPEMLIKAIDDFHNAFSLVLLELNEEQWAQSKQGLLAQIEEPDSNLRMRTQRYWNSIGNRDLSFDQRQKAAEALKALTRTDMIRFVVEHLKPRTADRLIMLSRGNSHQEEIKLPRGTTLIEDIRQFQKKRS